MSVRTIVVAEDERATSELVCHHLQREGYSVCAAPDGQIALRTARRIGDLLVLDAGLPGIDGFDVVRTLRRERRMLPIVMLTGRTDEIDRVIGFELGVDDYVGKPFSPRELIARIKAILRRCAPSEPQQPVLAFGRLEIDQAAREARVDGVEVGLKPREFALLLELASNVNVALSRERLLQNVWGFDFAGDERTVDVHVRRLRAKVEEPRGLMPMLRTVHGFGYKLVRPA